MTVKPSAGEYAPDGSIYVTPTDGSGHLGGTVGIDQTTDGTTNRVVAKIVDSGGSNVDWTAPVNVQSVQVATTTATIATGTSLSAAIDLSVGRLARIAMPATWDAANLTFQASYDNSTWNNLYDNYGNEYTVVAAASRSIIVPLADFISLRYLKIRSGTSGAAVNQTTGGTDRTLNLVLVP